MEVKVPIFPDVLELDIGVVKITSPSNSKSICKGIMASLIRPPPEIVRGQSFDVGPRYSGLTYIGEGAYGMVW